MDMDDDLLNQIRECDYYGHKLKDKAEKDRRMYQYMYDVYMGFIEVPKDYVPSEKLQQYMKALQEED